MSKKRLQKNNYLAGKTTLTIIENNNSNNIDNFTTKVMHADYFERNDFVCSESYLSLTVQIFLPFVVAGFGMVGAGLLLDSIQHYVVFEEITEFMILIPALLGLKGNLEMTLASRLSTQANLGNLDTMEDKMNIITNNLLLIQCQAIISGFIGSVAAAIMGLFKNHQIRISHFLIVCASSLITITASSLILGILTIVVILLSRKYSINPDNVATPMAATIGDLTALFILSKSSTVLHSYFGLFFGNIFRMRQLSVYTSTREVWSMLLIITMFLLLIPILFWITMRNPLTKNVLYQGWLPILIAMLISLVGGYILDNMVEKFASIAVFQPVINGVGGNLVAVQASRISTSLHKAAQKYKNEFSEQAPINPLSDHFLVLKKNYHIKYSKRPWKIFFAEDTHSKTARALSTLVIPGHLIFIYSINYIKSNTSALTANFVLIYLIAAIFQVSVLLYVAKIMICWMWNNQIDPDNSAIPYLTSIGDLLGITHLAIAFQFLYFVGERDNI